MKQWLVFGYSRTQSLRVRMEEFMEHMLTAFAAFAGIAAWDVVRTWLFSRWMIRRITRDAVRQDITCPHCGENSHIRINLEDIHSD